MIYPRCKADMNQIYITAEGYVVPCCWMGNEPKMKDYRNFHGSYMNELSLQNRELDEILADSNYKKIEQSWNSPQPYSLCQQMCSKPLPADFAQVQGTNEGRTMELEVKSTKPKPNRAAFRASILPIYWDTNAQLHRDFVDGLKIFYNRVPFNDHDIEMPRLFGDNIDQLLKEASGKQDYGWAVVFGIGNIFASQLRIVEEVENFIASIKEDILVAGHLMNKPGFYCGLHEQCFIVNLETYRRLGQPEFGSYVRSERPLHNYSAGPSIHDGYTPKFLTPVPGQATYKTKTCGWNFIDASLREGLSVLNLPLELRRAKAYTYPDDEVEKLNKNIDLLYQWEDLENVSQRIVLAHLLLKKLRLSPESRKGPFGYGERGNCLFFFNSQPLLPEAQWLPQGQGPIDQYSGPCSGFQDIANLKTFGFHPGTELIYFDINQDAIAMKEFIFENFDGDIRNIEPLIESIRNKFPDEEIFTGPVKEKVAELMKIFNNDLEDFRETWQKMRQLKRTFTKLDLLSHSDRVFKQFDSSKTILFNLTDIFLGQNELLYGRSGMVTKFNDMFEKSAPFPKLMLTGTSINQIIFLGFANQIDRSKI